MNANKYGINNNKQEGPFIHDLRCRLMLVLFSKDLVLL